MARILIVGGGCRGRQLAAQMAGCGHAVRASTRTLAGRARIEAAGAECWVGTPDRLATLRGALENVTIACWLLGAAAGPPEQLRALHGPRLEYFLREVVDTTVRGFIYEAAGTVEPALLAAGASLVRAMGAENALPTAVLVTDPADAPAWLAEALAALGALLEGR